MVLTNTLTTAIFQGLPKIPMVGKSLKPLKLPSNNIQHQNTGGS